MPLVAARSALLLSHDDKISDICHYVRVTATVPVLISLGPTATSLSV